MPTFATRLSKFESLAKTKKASTATCSLAETQPEKTLHCWGCGESGHAKNDPNCLKNMKKKGESIEKPNQKIKTVRAGEKSKKQLKCTHCGRLNHHLDHSFVLHPKKRPISEKEKALEAKIGELEKRFNIVASLGSVTDAKWTSRVGAIEPSTNPYMFGASKEMVAVAATRAQSPAKLVIPTVDETRDIGRTRHSGSPDHIGQA